MLILHTYNQRYSKVSQVFRHSLSFTLLLLELLLNYIPVIIFYNLLNTPFKSAFDKTPSIFPTISVTNASKPSATYLLVFRSLPPAYSLTSNCAKYPPSPYCANAAALFHGAAALHCPAGFPALLSALSAFCLLAVCPCTPSLHRQSRSGLLYLAGYSIHSYNSLGLVL